MEVDHLKHAAWLGACDYRTETLVYLVPMHFQVALFSLNPFLNFAFFIDVTFADLTLAFKLTVFSHFSSFVNLML